MRRSRRGARLGIGSAWAYLLRVTTRGFFGELSLGVLNIGKNIGRRVRLAALMFVPRLSFRRPKTRKRIKVSASRPRAPFVSSAPTAPPAPRPDNRPPSSSAPH
jgi:hypothetical protein